MKHKLPGLLLLLAAALVFSCSAPQPSDTPEAPSAPATQTRQPRAMEPTDVRPTPRPPTPTFTPFPPYTNKQVVLHYFVLGNHADWEVFYDPPNSFYVNSRLVLYEDGQLIRTGETYRQKVLSQAEIDALLSKLEALGFYSLESNQKHDPTDKLYDYGNDYVGSVDGLDDCIEVQAARSRRLCVYEEDMQYVIPKMKKLLEFLDSYEPEGMTPYQPDRLLLWVLDGRNDYDEDLPQTAIPWEDNLPPLEPSVSYVDGETAREIFRLFDGLNAGRVFSQNGKEYTVYFYIVLPHEVLTNQRW